jgi:hypothetical protein
MIFLDDFYFRYYLKQVNLEIVLERLLKMILTPSPFPLQGKGQPINMRIEHQAHSLFESSMVT